jgi:hypothetical protein
MKIQTVSKTTTKQQMTTAVAKKSAKSPQQDATYANGIPHPRTKVICNE